MDVAVEEVRYVWRGNEGAECVKGMAFETSWSLNGGQDLCWKK